MGTNTKQGSLIDPDQPFKFIYNGKDYFGKITYNGRLPITKTYSYRFSYWEYEIIWYRFLFWKFSEIKTIQHGECSFYEDSYVKIRKYVGSKTFFLPKELSVLAIQLVQKIKIETEKKEEDEKLISQVKITDSVG